MSQPYFEQPELASLPSFIVNLEGIAAQMVIDKIEEKKNSLGLTRFGKDRATQILLCELYELRKAQKNKD